MAPQKLEGMNLGKYQLREQLGHGGMASVYRAKQTSVGRDVAIKVLGSELGNTAEFMLRFEADSREMIVFPDGRAIIKNTNSESQARGYYAKYIGV